MVRRFLLPFGRPRCRLLADSPLSPTDTRNRSANSILWLASRHICRSYLMLNIQRTVQPEACGNCVHATQLLSNTQRHKQLSEGHTILPSSRGLFLLPGGLPRRFWPEAMAACRLSSSSCRFCSARCLSRAMAACCWPAVKPCCAKLSMARVRLFLLPGGRPRLPATFSCGPASSSSSQ